MRVTSTTTSPNSEATTSYGGESIVGFRVVSAKFKSSAQSSVQSRPESRAAKGSPKPASIAEMNRWLLKNAAKVDVHAKASTKRLIGRESV